MEKMEICGICEENSREELTKCKSNHMVCIRGNPRLPQWYQLKNKANIQFKKCCNIYMYKWLIS